MHVKPEWLFLTLALLFGAWFAIVTPPFAVADETGHWLHAVAAARSLRAWPAGPRVTVPESALSMIDSHAPGGDPRRIVARPRYAVIETPVERSVQLHNVCVYNAVGYLPAMLGLAAARATHASMPTAFLLGRLSSMLVSSLIIAWAIRRARVGKALLLFVALAPMSVSLRSSYSPDGLLCAAAILLAAMTVDVDETTRGRAIAALASALVIVSIKPSYLPLALVAPLLGGRGRPRAMTWLMSLGSMLLLVAVAAAVTKAGQDAARLTVFRTDAAVDAAGQLRHIAEQPVAVASLLARDLTVNGWEYAKEAIGRLGWFDIQLPAAVYWITAAAFVLLALERSARPIPARWLVLALALVTLTLLALTVYVIWTPAGGPALEGFQGRYLLPIAPFAIAVLPGNTRFHFRLPYAAVGSAVLAAIILLFALHTIKAHYPPGVRASSPAVTGRLAR